MLDSADDIEPQSPRLIRFKLTQPLTPQPHTRRIISLQSVLDFNLSPEATPQQIHEADQILDSILVAYSHELFREPVSTTSTSVADELFRADKLVRHLRDLAPPAAGRANVVRQALAHLYPAPTLSVFAESVEFNPIPPLRDILPRARIGLVNPTTAFSAIEDFARSLLEYFFVPLLAEGGKTSAPPSHASPNFYTSRSRVPPDQVQTSSEHRISARARCMERDDSRCVITGALDPRVYDKLRRSGATIPVGVMTAKLDAAHIIPHALNGGKEGVIKEENRFVWQVLEMFDPGVRLTLEGDKIDNPRNALMLDCTLHLMFGQLKWWLEEVPVWCIAHC